MVAALDFFSGGVGQNEVKASLTLSVQSGSNRRIPVSIGPGQTKRIDVREALGSTGAEAMGGLSLSLPGKESLSATQIVFSEIAGLAAMMKLFERKPDDQPAYHTLRAPMMALTQPDRGLGFPDGTALIPRIFLRNAALSPMRVSFAIDWRSEGKSGEFAPPALTLSPGEVRVINLADWQMSGQIPADAAWATVKLNYTGKRADLVPVAISYDKDLRHGLQTPFSRAMSHLWAGGMWHVDSTHNTFITTGNGGSDSTIAEATLFYNGGKDKYRVEKKLAPGQQLWIDVGQLIHDQVPDTDGHTMPPDTMTGSYELRDLEHAYVGQIYEGKLVIDKTYGHAAYGCGSCCGYTQVQLLPYPFSGPPNIDNADEIQAMEQCPSQVVDVTGGGYNWSSSNTAVATLPTYMLHTVAPGSSTGSAYIQLRKGGPSHDGERPPVLRNPGQPVTVTPCPTSASATFVDPLPLSLIFPSDLTGIGDVSQVSVAPSTTNFDGLSITETVSQTSNSCPAAVSNACVGSSTFVIGNSYQPSVCSAWSGATCTAHSNVGPLLVGTQDLFYDQHTDVAPQSLLSSGSCTQTCSQQYYCGTQQILNHSFTYTFQKSTMSGQAVTLVTLE